MIHALLGSFSHFCLVVAHCFCLFSVPVISVGSTCHLSAALVVMQNLPFFDDILLQPHVSEISVVALLSDIWHAALEMGHNFV